MHQRGEEDDLFPEAIALRQDLPCIDVAQDQLISYRKSMSELNKAARKEAKPGFCYICGKEMPQYCKSHTIPRYCLREIAVEGRLFTTAAIMEGNLLDREIGIGEAATFKQVCRKCDSEFFKLYETPETLLKEPSSQIMGQIATKNLLREIAKARQELGLKKALGPHSSVEFDTMIKVRAMDLEEDKKAFATAIRIGRSSSSLDSYHLIYYSVLPYTAPFAFQQMISPIADFEGGMINNSFNQSGRYRIEPIHLCILPSKGNTVVMVFRSEKAKRYRTFEKQFRALDENDKLQSFVKLIFTYSEDVLISKLIPNSVLRDEQLSRLAHMNQKYFGAGDSLKTYVRTALETALNEFAINHLPEPPSLLSESLSIKTKPQEER